MEEKQLGCGVSYLESEEGEGIAVGRSRANTWPSSRMGQTDEAAHPTPDGTGAADSGRSSHDDSLGRLDDTAHSNTFGPAVGNQAKKNSSRRNAWGNMSYADLITQAIDSSLEKRLTLSQIYDWMVQNIPYFKDKGDSNSSAGWKNSIRHNLSLHNRFKREQNEGTGKSSWWTINADAKPGKSTRRRAASMETQKYEKRRGRVRKQLEERRQMGSDGGGLVLAHRSPSSPIKEMMEYPPPNSISPLHNPVLQALQEPFRSRTNSNASSYGRLSPGPSGNFDDHTPALSPHPWAHDYGTRNEEGDDEFQPQMADLDVQLAHSMQLHDTGHLLDKSDSGPFFRNASGYHWNNSSPSSLAPVASHQSTSTLPIQPTSQTSLKQSTSSMDPFGNMQSSVMNSRIFSGGSFSSICQVKNPTKIGQFLPETSLPLHSQERLPSLSTTNQFCQPRPSSQQQHFRAALRSSNSNNNVGNGSFPADLDLLMDTVQPGFSGVDVDEFLNYEMNVGGNLLDVNFDSCLNGNQASANKPN